MYAIAINDEIVEFPIFNLQEKFPNITFFTPITADQLPVNVVIVQETPMPLAIFNKKIELDTPILIDGVWMVQWKISDIDAGELASRLDQLKKDIVYNIQLRLDTFAQSRLYDDMQSLVSYVGDIDPIFDAEGTYGKIVRSQTWRVLYDILNEVEANTRPAPTCYADIESELPELVWPE